MKVALIHGMNDGLGIFPGIGMYPLSFYLNTSVPEEVVHTTHSSGPTIDDCVEEIKKQLDTDSDWVLIGHSLGGVIATRLSHNPDIKVKGVVCFGSPLRGAALAGVAKHVSPWKKNPMYKELSTIDEKEPPCKYITFSGSVFFAEFDGKVFEVETKFQQENHINTYASHVLLAISPTVWRSTRDFINSFRKNQIKLEQN